MNPDPSAILHLLMAFTGNHKTRKAICSVMQLEPPDLSLLYLDLADTFAGWAMLIFEHCTLR